MEYQYDVLVIGSGLSGLSAALKAAQAGKKVCIISKEADFLECNTYYAQGGIVARGTDDSASLLTEDIIKAGSGLNYKAAVKAVSEEAPQAVLEILVELLKVPFKLDRDGQMDLTREAAHSVRRILHVNDRTGRSIMETFVEYIKTIPGITMLTCHIGLELITNTHNSTDHQRRYESTKVLGAYVLNCKDSVVKKILCPNVILATGGIGNLYVHTSNPKGATGDGLAMAYRAGAEIINSEYVQFHPTILFHRDQKRFLLSESLRGEGARLMNKRGEYFMEKYNPKLKDLAPRDEVARAIYQEMDETSSNYVFLDARSMGEVEVEKRFPFIYSTCLDLGMDMKKEPVPVVPAAHYFCGGIKADLNGRTNIPGLYAVGECSCTGIHGANRLASVSLLESLYFGLKAGEDVANKPGFDPKEFNSIPEWEYPSEEESFDKALIQHDMLNIQMTMWNYAGIVRTDKRLKRALNDLNYISHRIESFYKQAILTRDLIELRNSVFAASLIVKSAKSNKTSLGCHYLADQP